MTDKKNLVTVNMLIEMLKPYGDHYVVNINCHMCSNQVRIIERKNLPLYNEYHQDDLADVDRYPINIVIPDKKKYGFDYEYIYYKKKSNG